MKGKELGRGVIGMWRAPQSLSAARNFDQNGHVATVVTNVDPFEFRETKNETFQKESLERDAGQICFNFLVVSCYPVNPINITSSYN